MQRTHHGPINRLIILNSALNIAIKIQPGKGGNGCEGGRVTVKDGGQAKVAKLLFPLVNKLVAPFFGEIFHQV
jgi:hypothetical protein